MKIWKKGALLAAVAAMGLPLASCDSLPGGIAYSKVSSFGEYSGYSQERFDGWVRRSQYIEMPDGTKLAADILIPANGGVATDEKLPVVWSHTPYHRNPTGGARYQAEQEGKSPEEVAQILVDEADVEPAKQTLLKNGYVVVTVAVRGTGASYAPYEGLFVPKETQDAYDVIDWLSKAPFSDGNVGMMGMSYYGISQYMAASKHHPALKAIIPEEALVDMYEFMWTGGIYKKGVMKAWSDGQVMLQTEIDPVPVDEDHDGTMLAEARAQHAASWNPYDETVSLPWRDSVKEGAVFNWSNSGPSSVWGDLMSADVPIYHYTGWHDLFIQDGPIYFKNFPGTDKLTIGPWPHVRYTEKVDKHRYEEIMPVEHLRWFDRFLKGIKNGVETEAKVNYAVVDIPGEKWSWHSAPDWPIPGSRDVTFYLSPTSTGTIESVQDGSLATEKPGDESYASYKVDLSTTTGPTSRWITAAGGPNPLFYPDMKENDAKSLTYTSAPMEKDTTIVGYPIVTLFGGSNQSDGDFVVLVEEVRATGEVDLVTEGQLRASARKESKARWDNLGLPFQAGYQADNQPLKQGEIVELHFDLLPMGHLFNKGNRIRVTIMGADADNLLGKANSGTVLKIRQGGEYPSTITFPVLTD